MIINYKLNNKLNNYDYKLNNKLNNYDYKLNYD